MRSALVLSVAACVTTSDRPTPADNPTELIDSSGASFGWSCDRNGCEVVSEATTPPPPACDPTATPGYGFTARRFVAIAGMCDNTWFGRWQRPVACDANMDCPQLYQFSDVYRFECRNGLCQNADKGSYPIELITGDDAFLLCYGPFPRADTLEPGSADNIQITNWVNEACPDGLNGACALPLPGQCLQP